MNDSGRYDLDRFDEPCIIELPDLQRALADAPAPCKHCGADLVLWVDGPHDWNFTRAHDTKCPTVARPPIAAGTPPDGLRLRLVPGQLDGGA